MICPGTVVSFDAERGFGFIRSASYREDVFVHITAVDGRVPLRSGQKVRFTAEPAERGPRAVRVTPGRPGLSPALSAAAILAAGLIGATLALHRLGLAWVGAWLGGISAATWAVYAWDKRQASLGNRRVPEAVLLNLALIGGSPAALVAMMTLRHKTRKRSFQIAFAAVVLIQAVALVAWWRR
ncbi:DUF1294 domain-containing protein [Tundrisphaera sp. TA3]|uniref:DUF1294 domain-containing protein n=1 Tax=Tundrisphaera sp. TA3 TaxID=3435775 RepID=UPI003EBF5259